jgi:tetratricopeptide (TPR) repeat protein
MIKVLITSYFILFAVAASSQQADIHMLKAKVLMDQKRYDAALESLQQSPTKRTIQFYILNGDCYYNLHIYTKAIQNYLIADSLENDAASYELARSYAQNNDNAKAIEQLQKHLGLTHKRTELEIISDPAFARLSGTSEWKSVWKKGWYSDQEINRNSIAALIEKGKTEEALNELDKLKDKYYPKHEYLALLSKAYIKSNMNEPALTSINDAIASNSRSDEYFALRADLLLKMGRFSGSFDDMSKAIRLNPNIPVYYIKRAEIARLAGNFKIAESDLKIYEEINPESTNLLEQWGLFENKQGHFLNALDYYDKLIEKDQTKPLYFLERGNNAMLANQLGKADEDYGMALDLDPTLKEAYLQKGNVLILLQDSQGACYNWNKAKRLGSKEATTFIYQHCKE